MFKTAQKNIFIFSFSFNALSQKKIPPCRKKRYPNEFRVKAGVVTPQLLELTQDLNTHTAVLYCTELCKTSPRWSTLVKLQLKYSI